MPFSIAKLLEFITFAYMQPLLEKVEVPIVAQTAYRKYTSCEFFMMERGVCQGSVLPPLLFSLVVDAFLRKMQTSKAAWQC